MRIKRWAVAFIAVFVMILFADLADITRGGEGFIHITPAAATMQVDIKQIGDKGR